MLTFSRFNVWAEAEGRAAVFNGSSGSFTTMTVDERDRVLAFVGGEGSGDGLDGLLTDLVQSGVIVTEGVDELVGIRRRYDDSRWRSDTLGFTVVTSLGCNFDCPYCFEDKHPSLLKPEVAEALVGVLEDSLPSIRRLSVTWMGGEPLLGSAQLLALSRRFIDTCDANDKDYQASIITNGWYLDGVMAADLARARVGSAQVTVDGPPDVHDRNRPLVNGGPTFERILANLDQAAEHLDVHVRVNVDTRNAGRVVELLDILADAGLAGRVRVGLGRITDATSNTASPLASFNSSCLSAAQFGEFELAFTAQAEERGFGAPGPPGPISTPCTAVRAKEIVVGSDGEMWKCWDDIGSPAQAIGSVFDYTVTNDRLDQWFAYHPVDDPQCSKCIALPVCMGGCAHHEFHSDDPEARCGAFRHNHVGRITQSLRRLLGLPIDHPMPAVRPFSDGAVPVSLGPSRRVRSRTSPASTARGPDVRVARSRNDKDRQQEALT